MKETLLLTLFLVACARPDPTAISNDRLRSNTHARSDTAKDIHRAASDSAMQVSQYIRRMLQDREGRIWFGTTSDGVVRYDGQDLEYLKPGSNWVSSMVQDARGDIWLGTGSGVSRYDGTRFTTYTTKDGLASDQIWCLLLDKRGSLWVGTEEGVSRFDGQRFTPFALPAADLSKFPYYKYPKQVNWMIQDRNGNIWFATNGAGVFRYDGSTLAALTEKEGLSNNFVETILEDRSGDIWFGTRYGGLCRYAPSLSGVPAFTAFSRDQLKGDHVWTLHQTSDGVLWVAMARSGLCSFDGTTFTCFDESAGPGIRVVQSMMEDQEGRFWVGTSAGVYRYEGGHFVNWNKANMR